MIEILWHGRGGQGAFTAARLLGAAASMSDGVYALAFPSFGPERRGAPMRAFTKVSTKPIGDRSAISQAEFVIYLDDTLLSHNWDDELKPGGYAFVNSTKEYSDPRIVAIDANGISEKILGRPIPNTVFLGALSVLCESVSPDDVVSAIRQYMPAKLHEKNERIVAYTRRLLLARATGVSPACGAAENGTAAGTAAAGSASGGTVAAAEVVSIAGVSRSSDVVRTCAHIPRLRAQFSSAPSLDPAVFARTTCYVAGHLVAKNAGWRNVRPVVDASACTGCLQCYLYCPDGAIFKTKEDSIASRETKGATVGADAGGVASHAADAAGTARVASKASTRNNAEAARAASEPSTISGANAPSAPSEADVVSGVEAPNSSSKTNARSGAEAANIADNNGAGVAVTNIVANINAAGHTSGTNSARAVIEIDYDFCKGCGVCVKACRFNAIRMVPENEENVSRETFSAPTAVPNNAAVPTDATASYAVAGSDAAGSVGSTGISGAAVVIRNVDASICDLAGVSGGDRAATTVAAVLSSSNAAAVAPAAGNASAVAAPSLAPAASATESEVSAR